MRNVILVPVVTAVLSLSFGGHEVERPHVSVGSVEGSILYGITVHALAITSQTPYGAFRSFSASRMSIRYRPEDLFSVRPADALRRLQVDGGVLQLSSGSGRSSSGSGAPAKRPAGSDLPGRILHAALVDAPRALSLSIQSTVEVIRPAEVPLRLTVSVTGSTATAVFFDAVLPGGQAGIPWPTDRALTMRLSRSGRTVSVDTVQKATTVPVTLKLTASASNQSTSELAVLTVSAGVGGARLEVRADPSRADLSLNASPEGKVLLPALPGIPALASRFRLGPVHVTSGSITVQAHAQLSGRGTGVSLVDALIRDPGAVLRNLEASGNIVLSSWKPDGFVPVSARAALRWDGDAVTVESAHFDAGADGSAVFKEIVVYPFRQAVLGQVGDASVDLTNPGNLIAPLRQTAGGWAALLGSVSAVRIRASTQGPDTLWLESLAVAGNPGGRGASDSSYEAEASGMVDVKKFRVSDGSLSFSVPKPGQLPFIASLLSEPLRAAVGGVSGSARFEGSYGALLGLQESTPENQAGVHAVIDSLHVRVLPRTGNVSATLVNAADITIAPRHITLQNGEFTFLGGSVSLRGNILPDTVDAAISFQSLVAPQLVSLLGIDLTTEGRISGAARMNGSRQTPRLSASVYTTGLVVDGKDVNVSVDAAREHGAISVSSLRVGVGGKMAAAASGTLPFLLDTRGLAVSNLTEANFNIYAAVADLPSWLPESLRSFLPGGAMTLQAGSGAGSDLVHINLEVRHQFADAAPSAAAYNTLHTLAAKVVASQRTGNEVDVTTTLHVDGVQLAHVRGRVQIPRAIGTGGGQGDSVPIRGTVDVSVPLERVAAFFPQLTFAGGSITGRVALSGSIARPDAVGMLTLSSGELHFPGNMPAVRAVNGSVTLTHETVRLHNIRAELGYAPVNLSGSVTLPFFGDKGKIDVTVSGRNMLLITGSDLRVRVNADLKATGNFQGVDIAGSVVVTDATYARNIPIISLNAPAPVEQSIVRLWSIPGEFARRSHLSVNVRADRSVHIRNNLYTGDLSANIDLGGTLELPTPVGRVYATAGTVNLPVTSLDVQQILVQFKRTSPLTPEVHVRGTTQMRGYKLYVDASGTIPAVQVQVSSSPPLSEEQALLLLTTGYADVGLANTPERTVRILGEYLGRRLVNLLAPGQDVQAVLDRIEVSIGQIISESGKEVIQIEYRLGPGSNWYLEFQRDQYDRDNLGLAWRLWLK